MKKIALGLFITLMLLGCATAPVTQDANLLAKTQGYVFAYFPKTGAGNQLTVARVGTKETYTLLSRSEANGWGRWLPPGEYKISQWGTTPWGEYQTFTVKVGQVTDLGSLIPMSLGGYQYVILPVKLKETETAVQAPLREFSAQLATSEPISWAPQTVPPILKEVAPSTGLGLIVDIMNEYQRKVVKPSLNKQLLATKNPQDFFKIAKSGSAPSTDETPIDAKGNLYFGADFGQVRVRSSSGVWSSLDTASLYPVTAVEVCGNNLVAGYANGILKMSRDGGATWVQVKDFGSAESVLDIDCLKERNIVITGQYAESPWAFKPLKNVRLYSGTQAGLNDLTQLYNHDIPASQQGGILQIRGEQLQDKYVFIVPVSLFSLDLKTNQITDISKEKKVNGFHVTPNSQIITAWLAAGAFSDTYISTNAGQSWKEIDSPSLQINDIIFDSETKGIATRISPGMFTATPEFNNYDAVKNKWVKDYDGLTSCNVLLHNEKNKVQFCVAPGGNIFSYDKANKKWQAEFIVD
ncbi:hypothetical protein GCM10011613_31810 [Cellvibrio zantedeschiae]|uniref:BNR/Asp-box repeat protein n=1 Tax=Cellvibrio zantedeschiae TaxID=1237077 RepID=A0ABQ3B8Z8_9GAMM|nr:hypothetical protein [Cellvibrio zantedeschiae]GGY84505.1 hypothetical protein GCM10011613_31810 [Cellvibrio zantedeschiae]